MTTPMTTSMAVFQSGFLQALLSPAPQQPLDPSDYRTQPAFAVYRNTFARACIDALEANFPIVARLTGSAWFRAVAADYLRALPPRDARLFWYGERFADFLAPYATAHGLDYLTPVARLEMAWRASHAAADAATLDPQLLARLQPAALGATVLHPHPAARWHWCDTMPAAAIWQRERARLAHAEMGTTATTTTESTADDIAWHGDGLLLTRPLDTVQWAPLSAAGCAFMDACARGMALGEAAESALAKDPTLDLGALLHCLLDAGAFHEATTP